MFPSYEDTVVSACVVMETTGDGLLVSGGVGEETMVGRGVGAGRVVEERVELRGMVGREGSVGIGGSGGRPPGVPAVVRPGMFVRGGIFTGGMPGKEMLEMGGN